MKKRILALFTLSVMLLTGCGAPAQAPEENTDNDTVQVLATTYPVYLLTTALTENTEGTEVNLLVNSETSCLHDYTLTVPDMKAIESADVIVMNGAGMENFMSDALAYSEADVIDCSSGIDLLPMEGHHHEDEGEDNDEHEHDPHIWLDPDNAAIMLRTIYDGLSAVDERFAKEENLDAALNQLEAASAEMREKISSLPEGSGKLITFHDGFHYFARAFDLEILKSIEEEEGSEASAADIKEIVALVKDNHIPAIFTEKKGSTATAEAISRETGCKVAQLDMMMSGEGKGIKTYTDILGSNIDSVTEALR